MRLAGLGFELAAAIIGFAAFGYWLGRYFGWPTAGLAIGATLGIVGGLYNLIRVSLVVSRELSRQNRTSNESGDR